MIPGVIAKPQPLNRDPQKMLIDPRLKIIAKQTRPYFKLAKPIFLQALRYNPGTSWNPTRKYVVVLGRQGLPRY